MKRTLLIVAIFTSITLAQSGADNTKWKPFNFLIGTWEGNGTGKFGDSKIE